MIYLEDCTCSPPSRAFSAASRSWSIRWSHPSWS